MVWSGLRPCLYTSWVSDSKQAGLPKSQRPRCLCDSPPAGSSDQGNYGFQDQSLPHYSACAQGPGSVQALRPQTKETVWICTPTCCVTCDLAKHTALDMLLRPCFHWRGVYGRELQGLQDPGHSRPFEVTATDSSGNINRKQNDVCACACVREREREGEKGHSGRKGSQRQRVLEKTLPNPL